MASKKKTSPAIPQADPKAPLDAAAFLTAAQKVVRGLRDDLLRRADELPGVAAALRAQWEAETAARRTGDSWEVWRRRIVVQIAAAWVLSLVFVRTLEDRGLLDRNRVAGPGARDSQDQFQSLAPYLTPRDYLLTIFRELSNLPAAADLFDPAHNPVWKVGPSVDGTRALLDLFRAPSAETPAFRFGQADTRFLGDLYQSLDEETQERFALLQTPPFVEEYILDRTLERAIGRFGLDDTTLIDPTCGSGHFLLGAFERLVEHRLRKEPGLGVREAATKALDCVYGADINPYAVAIARFRLTLAFLGRGGYARLAEAPALHIHLVVADSLLHAPSQAHLGDVAGTSKEVWAGREFALEDEEAAKDVLLRRYAAAVGNPPYITVKDPVLRERYRAMYPRSAAGKYSLGAPFTERFFLLARPTGFVGMITANSFMKREFGKKLIQEFLPTVNVDGVVNTSGAYIPGHGTPTVLLFGSNEDKQGSDVLTVLAKRGEPATPDDPEQGHVWRSIAEHGGEVGFDNEYISVARVARDTLEKHPWSLGGGGAAELKELLEERAALRLADLATIGVGGMSNADDVYIAPLGGWSRFGMPAGHVRPLVIGEEIRDWSHAPSVDVYFPYGPNLDLEEPRGRELELLWPFRTVLAARAVFGGGTYASAGRPWWEWHQLTKDRYRTPLTIAFAEVATHNHFVLDRGGKVFKQTAPIIKLKEGATEDDHLALLAYLNSSTACFWMKQVFMNKGGSGIGRGIQDEDWEARFQHDGTKMATIPVPPGWQKLDALGREMLSLAKTRADASPATFVRRAVSCEVVAPDDRGARDARILARMVALQERIDFETYRLFGLVETVPDVPESIAPGARPFEVQLVRDAAPTAWFERHSYDRPKADSVALEDLSLPAEVRLIEQPTFKRRWLVTRWDEEREKAVAEARLDALETELKSNAEPLPARALEAWAAGSELLRAVARFDVTEDGAPHDYVPSLLAAEATPFLAAYRHTDAGLERRRMWERTWELQRAEDRGETVPPFDPPRKYEQHDYRNPVYWRLRGRLDVPKERFISYPGCESDEDKEPVYGWAGWDHLQRAIALATLYMKRKRDEAWGKERLVPMLAGLDELLPWIWQWHPEATPESGGMKPGQYIADFLSAQCQELGITLDDLRAWRPESAKRNGAGRAKKASARKQQRAARTEEEETP